MKQSPVTPEQDVDPKIWNYHPEVPIQTGGIFRNILNPLFVVKGIILSWFGGVYVRGIYLLLISLLWFTVFPDMATIAGGGWGWVVHIWLLNILMLTAWAGGMHLYFYTFARQGKYLQFSMNTMQKGKKYTFGDQVYDNMFWSLVWGVSIWTVYECGLLWLLAHGWTPVTSWAENPIWFVLLFLIIPFWDSMHFYTVHRLLHHPWIYKHAHSVHHRNISTGPWSGLSMHPYELIIYLSPVVIHLFLPSDPLHIVFHISWYAMGPATTHCGFQSLSIRGVNYPVLGDFFHALHHRFFQCNYGNSEVPLDTLNGSFHNGTQAATKAMRQRIISQQK